MRSPILCAAALVMVSCGPSINTAATSFLRTASTPLAKSRAICFAAPTEGATLAEDAARRTFVDACSRAASDEEMRVVAPNTPGCLSVQYKAETRLTRDVRSELSCNGFGACSALSRELREKQITFTLQESPTSEPVAEVHAAHLSTRDTWSERSIYVLCATAFRDFPRELRSRQYSVRVPSDL